MLKNYFKVKKDMKENKFGVFDEEAFKYWNSLSFFKKVKLANMSVANSRRMCFEIFEKPEWEKLDNVIRFHGLQKLVHPRIAKVLGY